MKNNCLYFILVFLIFAFSSCKDYTPKPQGYPYFELSAPDYSLLDRFSGFSFLLSERGEILNEQSSPEKQQFDICYPTLNTSIHCSYFSITSNNFSKIDEESRNFAYFHIRKSQQYKELRFDNPNQDVYGLVYKIDGEVVSPVQFVLTDSTKSYFRGTLHFGYVPDRDSIAPVIDYIDKDIQTLIESFRWKK